MQITSPHNPRIRQLLDLQTPKGRRNSGLFFMEGPHLLETLLDAGIYPREVYVQPALLQRTPEGQTLLGRLKSSPWLAPERLIEVSQRVSEAIGDVETSQGVLCVLPLPDFAPERIRALRQPAQRPALLILDRLSDPGNVGTLLRTALAADAEAVLLTANSVDTFSPKVVRAAAGAHVSLPIEANLSWHDIRDRVQKHCGEQMRVLLAESGSPHLYYEENLRVPFALIIGSEAHGASWEARELAGRAISIPLANGVESLNAAMAAGIILYEAVRQRRAK